jgi:cell division GTPase FtsZ
VSEFDFVDSYATQREVGATLPDNTAQSALNCGFVGVGGGGCKLAKSFVDLGFTKTVLVNTTDKDFDPGVGSEHLLPLPELDGVAKNIEAGKSALSTNSTLIEDALRTRLGAVDWLFVLACGGGGTGSAMGVLDETFRRYLSSVEADGNVVYVVTKPTAQELLNPTIAENYEALLTDVSARSYILLDNERQLNRLRGKVGVTQLYPSANTMFAEMLAMVLKLAAESSPVAAFDSKDLSRFLSCPGRIVMGSVRAAPDGNLGATLYQGCVNASPCPKPQGRAVVGAMLVVISEEIAASPEVSGHLEAASSYVGGRCDTLFTGTYVRPDVELVGLLALGGL